ncbi:MAG: hypothetical protein IPM66_21000 [Acidobacteriota bacterium]|nr:MAG: hypothetical protein IPM66_21000 [Acidobacteriota bacterium]
MNVLEVRRKAIDFFLQKEWPQQEWLSPMRFDSLARERGLSSIGSQLERWDQNDVFHPLVKIRRPFTRHTIIEFDEVGSVKEYDPQPLNREPLEDEDVVKVYGEWWIELRERKKQGQCYDDLAICPSADTFEEWSKYTEDHIDIVHIYYHPYQIFRLHSMWQSYHRSVMYPDFAISSQFLQKHEEYTRQSLTHSLESLKESEAKYLQNLSLLLLIEDRYLPSLNGKIKYQGRLGNEWSDSWYDWTRSFVPDSILERSGLTIEQVREFRYDLAIKGWMIDPNWHWFDLIRHATYHHRKKFKGEALLAWDYYEAAEILGLFLEDLTGSPEPPIDSLPHGDRKWKIEAYGIKSDRIDYARGNSLSGVLRSFGLDPRSKVLLFLEGESEGKFFERWCELKKIDLRSLGVRVVLLDGVRALKTPRIKRDLKEARIENIPVVIAVDDEQDSMENLRELYKNGLIDRIYEDFNDKRNIIGAVLWKPCFEDANFTFDELARAWEVTVQQNEFPKGDKSKIKDAIEEARLVAQTKTAIRAIEEIGKHRSFRLWTGKPAIATELANQFADADKPIIYLIRNVIQTASLSKTARYEPPPIQKNE